MAGAGYKTFNYGDLLSASDVQTYLQDQTVMYFGSTATRNSAIGTPSTGMVSAIGTGGQLQYYGGTAWIDLIYATNVAWTPTYSTTVTQGTGAVSSATYTRVGNTVIAQMQFTFGTAGAVTGAIDFSLPVAYTSSTRFTGSVRMAVAGTTYTGSLIASGGSARVYALNAAGTYAAVALTAASVPATWALNSSFTAQMIYEV
jgi:hypothetical protein